MSAAAATPLTETRYVFDEEVEARRDDADEDYDGWFCIATKPFPCPASGCAFVARYMTAAHLILVWPRIDDPKLLASAHNAKLVDRAPRIVEYERSMGTCVPWDVWIRMGSPVHGRLEHPEGWAGNAKERL